MFPASVCCEVGCDDGRCASLRLLLGLLTCYFSPASAGATVVMYRKITILKLMKLMKTQYKGFWPCIQQNSSG